MLVHHDRPTLDPDGAAPVHSAGAGMPLWDGSTTGMAASTLLLTPLTVQQNVPNIGDAQRAPKQRVDATLEQGVGRAPGWKWGWMKKNIPYAPVTAQHAQANFGAERHQRPRNSGVHAPGTGYMMSVAVKNHKRRPTVLAQPETVYYTAAMPPTPTWGEPL
jgi:hypothetical protein